RVENSRAPAGKRRRTRRSPRFPANNHASAPSRFSVRKRASASALSLRQKQQRGDSAVAFSPRPKSDTMARMTAKEAGPLGVPAVWDAIAGGYAKDVTPFFTRY